MEKPIYSAEYRRLCVMLAAPNGPLTVAEVVVAIMLWLRTDPQDTPPGTWPRPSSVAATGQPKASSKG